MKTPRATPLLLLLLPGATVALLVGGLYLHRQRPPEPRLGEAEAALRALQEPVPPAEFRALRERVLAFTERALRQEHLLSRARELRVKVCQLTLDPRGLRREFRDWLAESPQEARDAAEGVFAVLYSWAAEPEPDSAGRRRLAELSREAAALDVPEDLLPEAPKPWPDSLPGKFLIARFHGSLGAALSKKQAEVEFTEILAYVPEFAPAWYLRGRTRLELDQAEGALADFRQAARLDPRLPEAHRWAAVALDRLGRRAEAGKEAERALAGEPDYAEARELRERLKP